MLKEVFSKMRFSMKKIKIALGLLVVLTCKSQLYSHCQMPCGIYHDDMVYDQIDQYVETMYKGISVMNSSKFGDAKERNEFTRWVIQKEEASDKTALLLTQYFLQQKIKPGEADTPKRLTAVHNLLADLVVIKQNVDLKFVEDFSTEWEKFKLMFHREGYECDMEKIKLKQDAMKRAAMEQINHTHDHDDDGHTHEEGHDHDHGNGHSHDNDDNDHKLAPDSHTHDAFPMAPSKPAQFNPQPHK